MFYIPLTTLLIFGQLYIPLTTLLIFGQLYIPLTTLLIFGQLYIPLTTLLIFGTMLNGAKYEPTTITLNTYSSKPFTIFFLKLDQFSLNTGGVSYYVWYLAISETVEDGILNFLYYYFCFEKYKICHQQNVKPYFSWKNNNNNKNQSKKKNKKKHTHTHKKKNKIRMSSVKILQSVLTLSTLGKKFNRGHFEIYFYFSQKIDCMVF